MLRLFPWSDVVIQTNSQLMAALSTTKFVIFIFVVVMFLLSMLTAFLIPNEAGRNPRDPAKRRLWFWILGTAVPIVLMAIYIFGMTQLISQKKPHYISEFWSSSLIMLAIMVVGYIVLGFILSKFAMPRSKYGTIFSKRIK